MAPVVALSADAQESTKQLCLSSGMNGFFTKPMKKGRSTILWVISVVDEHTRGSIDPAHELRGSIDETRSRRPRPDSNANTMTKYPDASVNHVLLYCTSQSSTHLYCSASIQCTPHVNPSSHFVLHHTPHSRYTLHVAVHLSLSTHAHRLL